MPAIATPCYGRFGKRRFDDVSHPEDVRKPFQHDKDRVLHSTAFRRLQYKTQVYVIHEGDLYRTRLTHTLEVAQIARSLACRLQADPDLAEAIALAHDLGHTPFGHGGEQKLRDLLARYDVPFEHNVQSYRIVSSLEERYANFVGLNLTYATLEGILRHSTFFDKPKDILVAIRGTELRNELAQFWENRRPGAEAQIVNLADVIAYAAHDVEDAVSVGLIDWNDFSAKVRRQRVGFLEEIMDSLDGEFGVSQLSPRDAKLRTRIMSRMIIDRLIREAVKQTEANLYALGDAEPLWMMVRQSESAAVELPKKRAREVGKLVNKVVLDNIYHDPRVMLMLEKAKRIMGVLFQTFMSEPRALPKLTQTRLEDYFGMTKSKQNSKSGKKLLAQVVADYISGMTDQYAMDTYQVLTQAYEKAL